MNDLRLNFIIFIISIFIAGNIPFFLYADPFSPVSHLPLDEGTGGRVFDSISGAALSGTDSRINWCRSDIKGYPNKSFVKTGKNFGNTGVLEGAWLAESLDEYTFTFLTRITDIGSGCILNPLSSSLHFRFWEGTWDIAGSLSADPFFVKLNTWVRVTYVQTATQRFIYIDENLAAQTDQSGTMPAGNVRIGSYSNAGYYYPGEYTEMKIFDAALTSEEISGLCIEDGSPAPFNVYGTGKDLGGFFKREEHSGGMDSVVSLEHDKYRHWFNGDACWGALSVLIPAGNDSLWVSGRFFYPSGLTANHDFGSTAQTIAIYTDFGRSNPIAILLLNHDVLTNMLTLGSIRYRNTENGTTTVQLDEREIEKDVFHQVELNYIKGESGSLAFYLNGEEILTVSENFDLSAEQAMFGLNLGIHPEPPGDMIYSDNLYVGQNRLAVTTVPQPLNYFKTNEGGGLIATDCISGKTLAGIDTQINWCKGNITVFGSRYFIKSGANMGNTGVLEGNLLDSPLNEYTFTFLTRITDVGSGCILNPLSGSLHFRFWNGTWDIANMLSANPSFVKYNTWQRVTYVQSATEQLIYIDDQLAGQHLQSGAFPAGNVRIGAYSTTGFYYPGEYTEIKIFDTPLSADEIAQMCDDDGKETGFFRFGNGSDLGGMWKREEHYSGVDSMISPVNGKYQHWFNGNACWGALSKQIPPGMDSLWFSAEFYYPSTLTANHDFGTTAQTIGIYEGTGRSDPVAILLLGHDENTNVLTLDRIRYRNSNSGTINFELDGREVQKDFFHSFELNYEKGSSGRIAFYYNGETLLNVQGDFDIDVGQAMFGLNLGIHPEFPGNIIYSDNLYAGDIRLYPLLCRGDFNSDRYTDEADLEIFATDLGYSDCISPLFCAGSMDGDTDTDGLDLALLALEMGRVDCPCP